MSQWNPGNGGRPAWATTPSKRGSDGVPKGVPDPGEKPLLITICVRKHEKFLEMKHDFVAAGDFYSAVQGVLTKACRDGLLSLQVRALLLLACSFNLCRLVMDLHHVHSMPVLCYGRGCMSLVKLRNEIIFLMFTRIKYRRGVPFSAARGRVGAHLAASGCMPMPAHTHRMQTRHRRSARLLHEQIHARTSALHLHGRRTYAALFCRLPSHLMLTCSPLDGRVAQRRAAARIAAALLSPPREAARLPPLPPLPPSCLALRLPWPLPPTRNL
jgi:hypothetical protein